MDTAQQAVERIHKGDSVEQAVAKLREGGATIGEGIFMGGGCYIEGQYAPLLTIEDGVCLAKGVSIFLHDSALNNTMGGPLKFGRVTIRKNAYVGANSTILCGVEIGEGAIVGAHSLVTQDVPAGMVAFGSPATVRYSVKSMGDKPAQPGRFLWVNAPSWRETEERTDRTIQLHMLVRKWLAMHEPAFATAGHASSAGVAKEGAD